MNSMIVQLHTTPDQPPACYPSYDVQRSASNACIMLNKVGRKMSPQEGLDSASLCIAHVFHDISPGSNNSWNPFS